MDQRSSVLPATPRDGEDDRSRPLSLAKHGHVTGLAGDLIPKNRRSG